MVDAGLRADTPRTVRMVKPTCSVTDRAPDGGVKFPVGLVLGVGGAGLDPITARRWLKNGLCEPFAGGVPGDIVTAEERDADVDDLTEQIARLERLRARAAEVAAGRLAAQEERARVGDADGPIGLEGYRPEVDPLADYDLPDDQVERLRAAGFVRPDIIDAAADEDVLEVEGVTHRTLRKVRRGRATVLDEETE